jgi:hypothetical protein
MMIGTEKIRRCIEDRQLFGSSQSTQTPGSGQSSAQANRVFPRPTSVNATWLVRRLGAYLGGVGSSDGTRRGRRKARRLG